MAEFRPIAPNPGIGTWVSPNGSDLAMFAYERAVKIVRRDQNVMAAKIICCQ